MKSHNTGDGWTFVFTSAWRNSINTVIGDVGMLLGPCALKSLNIIENDGLTITPAQR